MNKKILSAFAITLTAILFTGCAVYPGYGYGGNRGYYSRPYYGGYQNYNRGYGNPGGYAYRGNSYYGHGEHEGHEHHHGWRHGDD